METPDTLKKEFQAYLDGLSAEISSGGGAVKRSPESYLEKARKFKEDADHLFADSYIAQYRQSLLYFSSAASFEAVAESSADGYLKQECYSLAGRIYHFSGHGFRALEEYRRSGISYNKSGSCYLASVNLQTKLGRPRQDILEELSNAIRSYRRAKGVWSDVGDYELAGKAYYDEQRTQQKRLFRESVFKGLAFAAWGVVTGYGESLLNWTTTLVVSIFAFALIYFATGMPAVEALNISMDRAFLVSNPAGSQWLLVIQIAYSYFILGLGLTILIRRFGPR